jgi:hypothetical protein
MANPIRECPVAKAKTKGNGPRKRFAIDQWDCQGIEPGEAPKYNMPWDKEVLKGVSEWASETKANTYANLTEKKRLDKEEAKFLPDPEKVKVDHVSKEAMPDSIDAMPACKTRTILKAIPDHVRYKSGESKAFSQTKTDAKSSEYRYDDNGQLVRRFTDGWGDDPWQLVSERAVKALPDTRPKFAPSGKPAIKWRKGNEKPLVTDKLGRVKLCK